MKIAHFNTLIEGGAAIAARRIHESLLRAGLESAYYFANGTPPNATYIRYAGERGRSFISRITRPFRSSYCYRTRKFYLAGSPEEVEMFSFPANVSRHSIQHIRPFPDVVHLHWVGKDFIDYPSFFSSIPDSLPIVWTLHDMNPFTGGCHYAWECGHFREKCGNCFQLGHSSAHDASYKNLLVKFESLRNKNVHIVADSNWLEDQAKDSFILSRAKTFQTIHYGLDHNRFYPKDKLSCRKVLGIDSLTTIIGFGADEIKNRRKGLAELLEALKPLASQDITVLIFGGKSDVGIDAIKNIRLGFIDSPELLSAVYSACDIFVMPSLYEAFGQTALEAMSCGTPVVGFDTGGIPDMVIPGKTGLLAQRKDVRDLSEKIQWMIDRPNNRRQMGINARRFVEQEFTMEKQAERYGMLYRELTN